MIHVRNRRRLPLVMPATVHIRRSYNESRYGQLHVTTAYPSGGGFDECTPLVCVHPLGGSSRYFASVLPELGRDRSLYAVDLPGHGSSDFPEGEVTINDLAESIGEFIDGLRLRTVDVMGSELGALVAIELALLKPQQIRRLVLASVPCHTAESAPADSASIVPVAEGTHLLKEWQRLQGSRGSSVSMDQLTDDLADALRSRCVRSAFTQAMLSYPSAKRLASLRQPGLLLRPSDEYADHAARAKSAYSVSTLEDLPGCGSAVFANGGQRVMQLMRQFLDH